MESPIVIKDYFIHEEPSNLFLEALNKAGYKYAFELSWVQEKVVNARVQNYSINNTWLTIVLDGNNNLISDKKGNNIRFAGGIDDIFKAEEEIKQKTNFHILTVVL